MIPLVVAAALASVPPGGVIVPIYTVQQNGGGLGFWVEETAVLSGVYASSRTRGQPTFWIVEHNRADHDIGKYTADGKMLRSAGWTVKHQWIDGRRCPALTRVISKLQVLSAKVEAQATADASHAAAAARLGIAQLPEPVSIPPSDTPSVSVSGGLRDLSPLEAEDYGGPISKWWWEGEQELASCWQVDIPRMKGRIIERRITGTLPTTSAKALYP